MSDEGFNKRGVVGVLPNVRSVERAMVPGKLEQRLRHPYSFEAAVLATAAAAACAPVPLKRMLTSVVPLGAPM